MGDNSGEPGLLGHLGDVHRTLVVDVERERAHQVADRVATPLWKTVDISFLVVALFHGLYGLWIVLDDYIHRDWLRVLLYGGIAIAALVFTTLGILTLLPFQAGG